MRLNINDFINLKVEFYFSKIVSLVKKIQKKKIQYSIIIQSIICVLFLFLNLNIQFLFFH